MLTFSQRIVVDNWLRDRVREIKANVRANFRATGATEDSVRSQLFEDVGEILGSNVLFYGQYGRGPTLRAGTGRKLSEIIREWIDIKGIAPKGGISKDELAQRITRKIHRDGIKVPNKYNKGKILTSSLNETNYKKLREAFATITVKELTSEILKAV